MIIIEKRQEVYGNTKKNEPALTDAGAIANFHAADNSASFKFKQKIIGVTGDNVQKMLK